jgi:hypothetical protein
VVDILLLQTVSIAIASASVVAGIVYYAFQLRHQARTRQDMVKARHADTLMKLYSTYGSKEFQEELWKAWLLEFKDYNEYLKKYGSTALVTPPNRAIWTVGWFFNGIGLLLHSRLVDIDQVDDLFGYAIVAFWERVKPVILEGYRPQPKMQKSMQWFEYLYNEMKKREQKLQQSKA